jgi:uncharacterized protein YcbK (DUF882 family)
VKWKFGRYSSFGAAWALTCASHLWVTTPAVLAERHYQVRQGQTLAAIAHATGVSVTALARANGLREEDYLKIGQRLVVPSGSSSVHAIRHAEPRAEGPAESNAKKGRKQRSSKKVVASFYRSATDQHATVQLMTASGRISPSAKKQLAALMRPRNSKKTKTPHPRLVTLLADVSKHFGGKPIHIISGYRRPGGYTKHTSRHTMGRAMDLRIPGVSVKALRDYCRTFHDVGVGYYPRSGFIHLDVRDKNAFWVDVSGPGEAPQYRRQGSPHDPADLESPSGAGNPPDAIADLGTGGGHDAFIDEDTIAARETGGEDEDGADEYTLSKRVAVTKRAPRKQSVLPRASDSGAEAP